MNNTAQKFSQSGFQQNEKFPSPKKPRAELIAEILIVGISVSFFVTAVIKSYF